MASSQRSEGKSAPAIEEGESSSGYTFKGIPVSSEALNSNSQKRLVKELSAYHHKRALEAPTEIEQSESENELNDEENEPALDEEEEFNEEEIDGAIIETVYKPPTIGVKKPTATKRTAAKTATVSKVRFVLKFRLLHITLFH